MDEMKQARRAATRVRKMAESIGMTCKWQVVPRKYLLRAEAATGIPRTELRPDLYMNNAASYSVTQAEFVKWARETFGGNGE